MSVTANVRARLAERLDVEVRVPSSGPKAGVEVVLPDGYRAVWRLMPSSDKPGWHGELLTPDGNWLDDLNRIPPGLVGVTVDRLADAVDDLIEAHAA